MTREDMVSIVSQRSGISKALARTIINEVFSAIAKAVLNGEKVKISELGIFEIQSRAPRVGRNPRTNAQVYIPARKVVVFKPSTGFKRCLERSDK